MSDCWVTLYDDRAANDVELFTVIARPERDTGYSTLTFPLFCGVDPSQEKRRRVCVTFWKS